MTSSFVLHPAAAEGFKDAKAYDAHRPSYPPEAVEALLTRLRILDQPNVNVVEIASGTGKFTELLAARHENYNIVAVEPHDGMREQLVAKKLRGVTTLDGHAARIPVGDQWGDACIAAQSFHWFATQETLTELHRVLKEKAVLGMIWNIEDYNKPRSWKAATKWEQTLNDWIWTLPNNGHPRFRDGEWQRVFTSQLKSNPLQLLRDSLSLSDTLPKFSLPLGEGMTSWTAWLSEEALWSRLNTLGQVAVLQRPQKDAALATFRSILQTGDVERNEVGDIAVHGHSYFAWTDRI